MAKTIIAEYYSASMAKQDKKNLRYSLSSWIPQKYLGSIPVKDRKGALMWAYDYVLKHPTQAIYLDKEQDIIDRYGDNDTISKPVGVVKVVQRKAGRAVIFYNVPIDTSQDEYMADLTPQGTLKNKR